MQSAFMIVLFAAIALFVIGGLVSTLGRGSVYDQIGQGGLSMGERSHEQPASDSSSAHAEREQEIRQMLQARSERRVRQGSEPLDIDAELAALIDSRSERPAAASTGFNDAALTDEVRQLVMARNARRERRGEQPLDVESEIARTLTELDSHS
ncbi:MAG TPA: hypothetical protein VID48_05970 [Solirubrobacteraceae bacterium]|jgi:hypothetical protein